jgi:hypothetical protein
VDGIQSRGVPTTIRKSEFGNGKKLLGFGKM